MRPLDGRVIAATAVAVFFVVFVSVSFATGSTPWHKVGVDAGQPSFEDMRSITSSWDCAHRGIHEFPQNPCDPHQRPENYPRIWTQLGVFGLGSGATVPLAIFVAVAFYLAALAVAGPLSAGEGVVYAVGLLAPATLLGVSRGNVDLLMFALVAVGVLLLRRSAWAGAAALTAAGALKLFPALALATLVRLRSRWAALAVSLAVLALYAALTYSDIRAILNVVPHEIVDSYGSLVLMQAAQRAGWFGAGDERIARVAIVLAGLALAAGLLALGRRRAAGEATRRLDPFVAGAAIYIGTYAFGSNFDYRLVFLLLCVPQLCAWLRNGESTVPWPATPLVAIVATLWLSSVYPPLPFGLQSWYTGLSIPPEELLNWFLFAWLSAALVSALRPALQELRQQ